MSLVNDLLTIFSSYSGGYRMMRQKIAGYEDQARFTHAKNASEGSMRVTLSRLKKCGFVSNKNGTWAVTKKGLTRLKRFRYPEHKFTHRGASVKRMIVAFDIPEQHKTKRQWLRIELVNLGFTMLQKSVWFGPAPLPREFIDSLLAIHILEYIKFFEARESNVV